MRGRQSARWGANHRLKYRLVVKSVLHNIFFLYKNIWLYQFVLILKKNIAVTKFSCFVLLINSNNALWRYGVILNNGLERLCTKGKVILLHARCGPEGG